MNVIVSTVVVSSFPTADARHWTHALTRCKIEAPARHEALNTMDLPVPQTPFVGRVRELAEAAELLRTHRLLTLVGSGGSGKTRLAIQLATDARRGFPDGVFWVPLAPVRDADLVELTIAQSVGSGDQLTAHLEGKRALIVLDNMEQVGDAALRLAQLITACPALRWIVTSREPLRLAAEQRFTVEPLSDADAVALFVERARAVDPHFIEDEAVVTICERLDRLPLALELAAARVTALTAGALLARLERRLPLLTGGARDAPERHRTLSATIEWSYDLLSDAERQLLRRLAIFAISFELPAAEAVCDADLATLSSLIDKSLVRRLAGERFGMLETVHEFAEDRLATEERDEIARRHLAFFLAAAENTDGRQGWPPASESFGHLDEEIANLRAALRWAQATQRTDAALRLGVALSRFWIDRGHHRDACEWLKQAPLDDGAVSESVRAASLEAAGMLDYFVAAEADQAERYYLQSLELNRKLGDSQRVAFLLNRLGRIARNRGGLEEAFGFHRDALQLFEAMADNAGRAATLHLMGETARDHGEVEEAERLLGDAIRLGRASYPALLRHSLHSLGDLCLDRADYRDAMAHYNHSLELTGAHEIRSRLLCVAGVGSAMAGLQHYSLAALVWGSVEAQERGIGFRILSDERNRYERWAAMARENLGEEAFLAAYVEGETLPLDDALSRARGAAGTPVVALTAAVARAGRDRTPHEDATFEREGEYWTIGYEHRVLRLRDSKGLHVLAHLLADPGRPHAALDLERLGAPGDAETARAVATGGAGWLLDDEARRAYRTRIAELREAIEEAVAWDKATEVGLLREEMDFITHELSRSMGLGGQPRRAGSVAERARLNVMRAVRSAMRRIAADDPGLGAHLEATIHTGTVCVYTPDPRGRLEWRVSIGDFRPS